MKAREVIIGIFAVWENAARLAAHNWHYHAESMALRLLRGGASANDSWSTVEYMRTNGDGWRRAGLTMRRLLKMLGGVPVDVQEQNAKDKPSTPWEKRNASGDMSVEMSRAWRARGWIESPNVSGIAQDELDAKYERESIKLDRDTIIEAAERHGLLDEDRNESKESQTVDVQSQS